jgi:hypothetical protein
LVVGAPYAIDGQTPTDGNTIATNGGAYTFVRTNSVWTRSTFIAEPNRTAGDTFGSSLALAGNTLVVGGASAGVYAFVRSGIAWTMRSRMTPPVSIVGEVFGSTVALSPDLFAFDGWTVSVGPDAGLQPTAAVYVFR